MALQSSADSNFRKIEKLIDSSRFNESFLLLKREMNKFPILSRELDKLKNRESTYRYMLDFLFEGHSDPSHKETMEQIRDALHRANDIVYREAKLADSSDLYSSTRRLEILRKTSFKSRFDNFMTAYKQDIEKSSYLDPVISPEQAQALDEIFNFVWTMTGSPVEDYEGLSQTFTDPELPDYFKALLTSAIILGNLAFFDPELFELLLNIYESTDSTSVKARAIVGILLISLLNSSRLTGNLELRSRLMLTADDPELKQLMNEVIPAIVRTYDTKRIDNKMRNEVIPGLMKIQPEIIDKIRNLSENSDNFLTDDLNPQWEELVENSEIGAKIQEINDMQMEGADVMVTAFSNLKGFPFFNKVSNWFMPFVPGNHQFGNLPFKRDDETVARFTTVMCDSDLHSFLLSIENIPEDKRNLMLSNMERQMKEAKEAMENAVGETDSDRLTKKIRHALQDLYRFFKFFRKKDDFADPFASPILASHISPLMSVLNPDPAMIRGIAEFYFKNKYYEEAIGLFELTDSSEADFSVWEKIGYAYDRLKVYDKAVEWYGKADLVNPGNRWLEKKLAIALKNAGRREEALEYYYKALTYEPENYHLLMSLAQCLLDLGNTAEALQHLYHAQYLKPEKPDVSRAIAWAELLGGDHEKARQQYEKILASPQADNTDYLNAAHGALAAGDLKRALNLYKTFVDRQDNRDITALVLAFRDDSDVLKKIGVKTSDLRLVIDKIRYGE